MLSKQSSITTFTPFNYKTERDFLSDISLKKNPLKSTPNPLAVAPFSLCLGLRKEMLHLTLELFFPVENASFAAFCLCNLIVALLLMMDLGRGVGETDDVPKVECYGDVQHNEEEEEEKAVAHQCVVEVETASSEYGAEEEGEELMKRAEEFIQKMVRRWQVEKEMQTS
ncbi:hypothetical protein HPP92_001525 [Vanilla planifolia]|uniref:Uncharacterized protein n=1 Tax=Vanilla planifolia TaxID=51239 RepID=A0A835RRU3_VANPL|nr:hypothetical protein HPP92_001525 [Vanilla planifolia]